MPNASLFLTKFAAMDLTTGVGGGYQYTDFLAGNPTTDTINSMAIDGLNRIYLAGTTASQTPVGNIPVFTPQSTPYIASLPSTTAGFVAQLQENAATTVTGGVIPYAVITYGTFIGGTTSPISATSTTGVAVTDIVGTSVANIYLTRHDEHDQFLPADLARLQQDHFRQQHRGLCARPARGPATKFPSTVQLAGSYVGLGDGETGGSIAVDTTATSTLTAQHRRAGIGVSTRTPSRPIRAPRRSRPMRL